MADLQVIFASNPTKDLSSEKKDSKVINKETSRMKKKPSEAQKRAWAKLGRMAKKRAKIARAAKRAANPVKRKKNPVKLVASKGKRKVNAGSYSTKKEIAQFKTRLAKLKAAHAAGYLRKRSRKGRAVKKTISSVERRLKANAKLRRAAVSKAAALRKKGYKVKKVNVAPKSMLKAAVKRLSSKSKKGKKKRSSKRAAKRVNGRESIVAKKRKSKRKVSRKKSVKRKAKRSPRKRSARKGKRRAVWLTPKRRSITIRRKNPIGLAALKTYTGFEATELGSLLVGGAIYGAVNGAAAKYLPQVYAMAAKIPVVGTTVVPALIGAALKFAGVKTKVKALELVGEGLVAASVVGMGINAAQYIPGLAPEALSGVDFTPAMGGYLGSGQDFGRDPGSPDFGAVDYTPEINGGGFLGQAQMGSAQLGRDPGSPDFGEIPAGLGEIPEGMGSLG